MWLVSGVTPPHGHSHAYTEYAGELATRMAKARAALGEFKHYDWVTHLRWHRLRISFILSLLHVFAPLLFVILSCERGLAQSVVGASTSTRSTTAAARKSFYDSGSGNHWVFWYTGSQIDYASSSAGTSWTTRGNLAYNTPNFSVAFKVIAGTSYVFLVTEADTYDIVVRRGTISGTTITFDSAVTVLDGSSASDKYILPFVALDSSDKVWTAAFKDLGDAGDRYRLTARRTTNSGSSTLSFDAASSMGQPAISVSNVAVVPLASGKMLAAVSGVNGNEIITYEYDGSAWNAASAGGNYSNTHFAQKGFDQAVRAITFDSNGDIYVGGEFTSAGGIKANRIARWNGTSWSTLAAGMDNAVYALTVDSSGALYAAGAFTTAGGVTVNRVAKWNGSAWSALSAGVDGEVRALACDSGGNLYAGGAFTTAGGGNDKPCSQVERHLMVGAWIWNEQLDKSSRL